MRSRVHQHGYYAPMEDFSLDIRRYVTERLALADRTDRDVIHRGPTPVYALAHRVRWRIFAFCSVSAASPISSRRV